MISWRVIGHVYKYNPEKKKITLCVKGEHAEKLSSICKSDKKRFYFFIGVGNVQIRNELILKHIEELEEIVGMEIDISGYAKKYRFKLNGDMVEGISLHANTIY